MPPIPNSQTSSPLIPVLEMQGIRKAFPGVRVLDDVSLRVLPGQVHALMGENGAGKSTLMKILAGALKADGGTILLNGQAVEISTPQQAMDLGIGIIYQELNLAPHLSIAENIFLGREPRLVPGWIDGRKMRRDASALMTDLGMTMDVRTPVGSLSVAQRQMVEIAKATSRQARVLAMDEPSATLTAHELENLWRLIRRLQSQGIGIVYISHRMDEVFQIADAVTVLRDGKIVGSAPINEIGRDDVVRLMVGRDLDETYPKIVVEAGRPVLEVSNLSRRGVLENISFTVHAGEVVALAGLVGSGRTEIARCLFGADKWSAGEMRLDGKPFRPDSPNDAIAAGIGFVTEDRKEQGVVLSLTVRENISLASLEKVAQLGFIRRGAERTEAQASVARLRVRTPSVEQQVGNLSGGNQQKVVLGKWLETPLKLLILDEPTRGIDVGAKREIYGIMNDLAAQGVAILMISSELPEVLGMADKIIVVRDGRIAGQLSRDEATQEKVGQLALAG
ncbi:MAG: sugar ABC transporter ATP-binding protein [Janthinobacterium lividum]